MTSPRKAAQLHLPIASVLVISALALGGCVTNGPHLVTPKPPPIPDGSAAIPSNNVAVLSDGNQVVAKTAAGQMKIEAGPGLRRIFDWDGMRRGVITQARKKSFAGGQSKGITFDGKPSVWADANGIDKLHYEEGRRHFETVDDALIWMQIRRLYFTYTNQGLVLGWRREGDTLHVELWQFYIDGKKPISMPDAHDADIVEGKLVVQPQKMHPHLVFDDGHTEPYNQSTANQYKPVAASSGAATKRGTSCNWFQRAFTQCEAKAAAAMKAKADAKADAKAKAAAQAKRAAAAAAAAAKPQTPPPETHPSATISGSTVNIRSGSGTKSDVLFQAKKGDQVEILKKDSGWRYVKFDDGRKGWVADFLLKHQGNSGT